MNSNYEKDQIFHLHYLLFVYAQPLLSCSELHISGRTLQGSQHTNATVLKPVEGYKFVLMGETVAAVQTYPFNKRFVWLRNDLSENLKFILAAGATTLLVRSFNPCNTQLFANSIASRSWLPAYCAGVLQDA